MGIYLNLTGIMNRALLHTRICLSLLDIRMNTNILGCGPPVSRLARPTSGITVLPEFFHYLKNIRAWFLVTYIGKTI